MKNIAIIPARGGSKRIPRKNIKLFKGKPIIEYSLQTCKKSGLFEKIHVSTEDESIAKISTNLGFKPDFLRSNETASDTATIQDVLQEVVNKFDKISDRYDIICLMSATAPLINASDLQDAWSVFDNSDKSYPLLAVSKYPVPIEWALRSSHNETNVCPINSDLFTKSSHTFKPTHYDTGTFAIFTMEQILSEYKRSQYIPFVIDSLKGIDVDTMEDWQQLEKAYSVQYNGDK